MPGVWNLLLHILPMAHLRIPDFGLWTEFGPFLNGYLDKHAVFRQHQSSGIILVSTVWSTPESPFEAIGIDVRSTTAGQARHRPPTPIHDCYDARGEYTACNDCDDHELERYRH